MKETKYYCDINGCKKETDCKATEMQVIFYTSQTDGAAVPRYFSNENMNICKKCLDEILASGKYIIASGAQGYNTYQIQD